MENKELTLEQALGNIEILLNEFVGKKSDHITLEQSLILIKGNLKDYKELLEKSLQTKEVDKSTKK